MHSHPVPVMLSNFRKRYSLQPEEQSLLSRLESQADAPDIHSFKQTASVPGCTCAVCAIYHEIDEDAPPTRVDPISQSQDDSLPSTRSIIRVLYPPSYLGAPSPCPDPPSYFTYHSPEYSSEISPLISSTTTKYEGTCPSHSHTDPLSQDPSLTGVPSQGVHFSRAMSVEPVTDIGACVYGESEPLPDYSRFDPRQPRFPSASGVLGPYPPLSTIRQSGAPKNSTE